MKFYYIWTTLFSFELKKYKTNTKIDIFYFLVNRHDIQQKKTLEIRNMSPKNVIKIINIQKCYLGHISVNVHGSSKSKKQKEDDNG